MQVPPANQINQLHLSDPNILIPLVLGKISRQVKKTKTKQHLPVSSDNATMIRIQHKVSIAKKPKILALDTGIKLAMLALFSLIIDAKVTGNMLNFTA